jgi:hypothetical protein
VYVTEGIGAAHGFFCKGLESNDPFHLDSQWICATNKPVNQINYHLQQWRSQEAQSFGILSAFTEPIKSFSNCSELSGA